MSALNSGVNDRRGRAFFRSTVSMMGILSGASPLMVDVRQTGSSPHVSPQTISRWAKEGRIGYVVTLGGHRRFRGSEIRRLADGSDPSPPT